MEYGIKPETQEENAIELNRMKALAKEWGLPHSVYSGKTNDINLRLTWYCPHCLTKLEVSRVVVHEGCAVNEMYKRTKSEPLHETLCCNSHPEVCGYSFENKALRRESNTWWSSGFKYPLNPMELHQLRIEEAEKSILNHEESIKRHKSSIAQQEHILRTLKSQSLEVQASMLC